MSPLGPSLDPPLVSNVCALKQHRYPCSEPSTDSTNFTGNVFRIFPFILIGKSTMAYLIGRNFDLECKHNKHKTAFQARKVTPRLSRNRPQNKDFSAVSQSDLTRVYCRLWRRPYQGWTRKIRKGENTCLAIHSSKSTAHVDQPNNKAVLQSIQTAALFCSKYLPMEGQLL